jgi:hypothetical protein
VYVLLWLSIAANTDAPAIIAATWFYFVGATIGLFNPVNADWRTGANRVGSSSDYNLGRYRLIGVPLLSSVATVFGVLLTSSVAISEAGSAATSSVKDTFDFINHPISIFVAAIFGLTPGLLLDGLESAATQRKLTVLEQQANDTTGGGSVGSADISRGCETAKPQPNSGSAFVDVMQPVQHRPATREPTPANSRAWHRPVGWSGLPARTFTVSWTEGSLRSGPSGTRGRRQQLGATLGKGKRHSQRPASSEAGYTDTAAE